MRPKVIPRKRGIMPPKENLFDYVAGLESQLSELRSQVRQAQQLSAMNTAAASIAHEFNNLLTPLLAYTQYALESDDLALREKALRVTQRNGRTMMTMSDRLLQLAAPVFPNLKLVGVKDAAQEAHACLCRDLDKDGIRFVVAVEESVVVWMDPIHLQQVLFNLLLNARDAMAPQHGGTIKISARRAGEDQVIEVRDTGPGIPANLIDHVFEPLATSKPAQNGQLRRCSGLGLSLCRDLVEEVGGSITVTSLAEAGTTFEIRLRASEPQPVSH